MYTDEWLLTDNIQLRYLSLAYYTMILFRQPGRWKSAQRNGIKMRFFVKHKRLLN